MRILKLVFLFLLFVSIPARGDEQIIAGAGAPSYNIVLPDDSVGLDYLRQTAELMQEGILSATGSKLEIISEKDAGDLQHGIYIGQTEKAAEAGIDTKKLSFWEYIIKTDGQNIFIVGRELDRGNWIKRHHRYFELGSCKGAVDFLKEHAGLAVLASENAQYTGRPGLTPGSEVHVFTKRGKISVNSDVDRIVKPRFLYSIGRELSLFYRLANNMLNSPWMKSYGGHSHDKAIPKSLHSEHPEYFALMDGTRELRKRPMYCLSNKEVQERIYQEMKRHLKYADWVQLAQTDGFKPCECEECKKLFSVEEWSEKLWILHRNMAERLYKEMPDKNVVILSYADTTTLPKTFKKFPPNVIIELCKTEKEDLAKWSGYEVPGGFTAYVYNWGYYHPEGFTPTFSGAQGIEQLQRFSRFGIRGIYTCGLGEIWGLQGPAYYTYGQAMNDPERADATQLLKQYCSAAFGPGAEEAEKFFHFLDSLLSIKLPDRDYDFNRIDFTMPEGYDNYLIIAKRYTPENIRKLENLLSRVLTKTRGGNDTNRKMAEQIALELKYLKVTSELARSFISYLKDPGGRALRNVYSKINTRQKYLDSLPHKTAPVGKSQFTYITTPSEMKFLGGYKTSLLRENGNWAARFYYPLTWNIRTVLEKKIYPGARTLKAGKNRCEFAELIPCDFRFQNSKKAAKVGVTYGSKTLRVKFVCEATTPEDIANDQFMVRLKNEKMENELSFDFKGRDSKATVSRAQPENPYNGIAYTEIQESEKTSLSFSSSKDGKHMEAVLSVSLELFDSYPRKGDAWRAGFSYIPDSEDKSSLVWEPDITYLNGKNTRHLGRGKLLFR